jgi:hypothetical protein
MKKITITMVEVTADFFPPSEGKYLVRTVSNNRLAPDSEQYLQARLTIHTNDKGVRTWSVDVNNQVVTHISTQPLEFGT